MHNRFHHAIGALHLMQAIMVLRAKGTEISDSEAEERVPPSCFTTLDTDRSATPEQHREGHHEDISTIMARLNEEFNGVLTRPCDFQRPPSEEIPAPTRLVATGHGPHGLPRTGQHSGVAEGKIGSERIIKMLAVEDNELVVEEKGIY